MANDEAKVRVRLDTGPAKAALEGLQMHGASVARGIGSSLMRSLGIGAGIGAGMQAASGAAQSGLIAPSLNAMGSITGEFLGPFGAKARSMLFDGLDAKSIAAQRAREETIGVFGLTTGAQGKVPEAAANFNSHVRQIREQEEAGRHMIENDSRFYGLGEQSDSAAQGLVNAIQSLQQTVQNMSAGFGLLFAGK